MWVVKLGGSLQSFPGLRDWVRLIAEQGGGRVVLVPGGGQFADAVRAAQRTAGFDDRTAHGMALFAMEQYGLMLAALLARDGAAAEAEMRAHILSARQALARIAAARSRAA